MGVDTSGSEDAAITTADNALTGGVTQALPASTTTSVTTFVESGTSSWKNPAGETETREFTFNYAKNQDGSMGNFLGGTETVDGATITFNADWNTTGRAKQVDSNATPLSNLELEGVPTALQSTLTDNETYADVETYDWGTETTYYDSAGTVLGYSSVNTWSYDDGSGNTVSGTNINFNDANWNHLGSSWSDAYGSGSTIVTFGTDDGSGTLTGVADQEYRKEVHTFTEAGTAQYGTNGSVNPTETRTYYFNDDEGDSDNTDGDNTVFGDLLKGTEVFGATTVELGPNWTIVGETFDLTAGGATDTDLSALPTAFTSTFIVSGTLVTSGVKEMTETFPWGGSETTYFDASSNVLGKKWSDSHTYTDENGTAQTSSHVSYSKANGDHIGNSWSDSYGSGSSFIVEKTDDSSGTITGTGDARIF